MRLLPAGEIRPSCLRPSVGDRAQMPKSPLARRLMTVPTVITMFLLLTLVFPLLVVVAGLVDLGRWVIFGKSWVSIRVLVFSWMYLLGELWALAALAATAPFPMTARIEKTFRLQQMWTAWNWTSMRTLFSVDVDVDGLDSVEPGPVLVMSRHASVVDTLLPAVVIAKPMDLRIRYVLKAELLADPVLDIAGNRLPNVFVDRFSGAPSERSAIGSLAGGIGPRDGVLIYPEGTRFSEAKLRRRQHGSGQQAQMAANLQFVLPPKPGGVLALLDATDADVVVFAHHGLEGLASLREIWAGGLVGSRIAVRMWRVPRSQIPQTDQARVDWLHRVWAQVDNWLITVADDRQDT